MGAASSILPPADSSTTNLAQNRSNDDPTLPGIIGISNDVVGRMMTPTPKPPNRLTAFLDTYLIKKLKTLRRDREEAERELEAEYERQERVKELNRAFVEGIMWVNNKKKVMECYQKYPNHPMMCAEEVRAFTKVVPWVKDGQFTMEA